MSFSSYFRISSYAMLGCATLMLLVSGGIGVALFAAFVALLIVAWKLENTKWQISERVGLVVVIFSLPLFYLDWKILAYTGEARDRIGVSTLAHLILFLSAVKLLQTKADRDWVFLYLISFFEVLLAAGLSISPLFLVTLSFYLLFALSTIIAFEIKKSSQNIIINETRLLITNDSTFWRKFRKNKNNKNGVGRRLPLVAVGLLIFIFALALPLFFVMPRYGNSALAHKSQSISKMVGFSGSVNLGEIGELKTESRTVMRVRVEGDAVAHGRNLRWRGVALDYFNGRSWQNTTDLDSKIEIAKSQGQGIYQLGSFKDKVNLTVQTFYLEPTDTPYLFAAPRAVAIQGNFLSVKRDQENSILVTHEDSSRTTYTVISDTFEPDPQILREDKEDYSKDSSRHLQLPELDPRIKELTQKVIKQAGATNRYDIARAIESHLQTDYGYTLKLEAKGKQPLADFLFRVRAGHCEYFASAMVVMLRTQGIAARLVNGFQTGEYNDASDAYTVTTSDAHSWVEVYFPETDMWITFDPTPAAGRETDKSTGIGAFIGKYADALELFWIQYVVGYDSQEQRSLASSVGKKFFSLQDSIGAKFESLKKKVKEFAQSLQLASDKPLEPVAIAQLVIIICFFATLLLTIVLFVKRKFLQRKKTVKTSVIEFYERMTKILAGKGFQRSEHETPLEFANATGFPEAMKLTLAYNRVRYGGQRLSGKERDEIEKMIRELESRT